SSLTAMVLPMVTKNVTSYTSTTRSRLSAGSCIHHGIFNVGTGRARSFRDLISIMFNALGRVADIEYIDMPPTIREQYQYFTQADVERLRPAPDITRIFCRLRKGSRGNG